MRPQAVKIRRPLRSNGQRVVNNTQLLSSNSFFKSKYFSDLLSKLLEKRRLRSRTALQRAEPQRFQGPYAPQEGPKIVHTHAHTHMHTQKHASRSPWDGHQHEKRRFPRNSIKTNEKSTKMLPRNPPKTTRNRPSRPPGGSTHPRTATCTRILGRPKANKKTPKK